MNEIDETLDALERRLGPAMTLGQREMVLVRLRGLPLSGPQLRRGERIAEHVRELDRREFAPLSAQLRSGELTPDRFRERLAELPPHDTDGWARRVFGLHEVPSYSVSLSGDMVGYVTTHVIQVLEMASELGPDDVFYDLGSGLGFVPILASWLSGARAVGVEIEPNFVKVSRDKAEELHLSERVRFVEGDLREQSYDDATALFMFYPLRGDALDALIERVHEGSAGRSVKLYSLGLSGPALAERPWIKVRGQSPSGLVALETVVEKKKKRPKKR